MVYKAIHIQQHSMYVQLVAMGVHVITFTTLRIYYKDYNSMFALVDVFLKSKIDESIRHHQGGQRD